MSPSRRRRAFDLLRAAGAVAAVALVGPVVLLAGTTASGAGDACTPGVRQVSGGLARIFCGPATAQLTIGRTKVGFGQGQCDRTRAYFTINIGTTALDPAVKPKPAYFGITVGRTPLTPSAKPAGTDGTYTGGVVTFVRKGKVTTLRAGARVTLKSRRTAGSFRGVADTGQPVSGSFRC
jgi:hypothetical protein